MSPEQVPSARRARHKTRNKEKTESSTTTDAGAIRPERELTYAGELGARDKEGVVERR